MLDWDLEKKSEGLPRLTQKALLSSTCRMHRLTKPI